MQSPKKNTPNTAFEIEQLTAQLMTLTAENAMLEQQNQALSRDNEALSTSYNELNQNLSDIMRDTEQLKAEFATEKNLLKAEINKLAEMIRILNARHFGAKSEKIHPFQISLFNDMEAAFDVNAIEQSIEEVVDKPKARKKKQSIDWSKYETEIIEHRLAPTELVCPACGDELKEMGMQVKRVIKIISSRVVVEEHRQYTYVCPSCSRENQADGGVTPVQIMRAPMPEVTPIEGSCASASLVAQIMYDKYCLGLPIYRIAQDLKSSTSLTITRQTMALWVIKAYNRWLSLIYSLMRERLLSRDIIHCDETRTQVLKEPKRKPTSQSYAWLFCSASCDVPIYVFQYDETRAREVVATFLDGWSGYIITDGYQAYDKLGDDVLRVACLVHIRRKFTDILKSIKDEAQRKRPDLVSVRALRLIEELFHIDNTFNDMTAQERYAARLEHLKPKMDAFYQWCLVERDKAVPTMALRGALNYTIEQWPSLENALLDGRLPLENNRAERGIKPYVIGRKNWLFSDTPNGATASCGIYSIVATARENGLEPRRYLTWLFEQMPNTADIEDVKVLESFMPWSADVPASCKLTQAEAETPDPMAEPILDVDPQLIDEE